ncbi:MAG: hypothetical protein HKN25_03190 [Pyrinomonadaceae bacterium]|nr:hypothetical protein [Pyrinomonadaceae bacterium]
MSNKTPHKWSRFEVEVSTYYINYFYHFVKLNPHYQIDLEETLFPPFLEIRESHFEAIVGIDYFYEAATLVRGDDHAFYVNFIFDSVIEDREVLKRKCFEFASKFRTFLRKYHLFNEGYSDVSNNALANVVLTAVFIGKSNILNSGGLLSTSYPNDLLTELWKTRSQTEWLEAHEKKFNDLGVPDMLAKYKSKRRLPFLPPSKKYRLPRFLPSAEKFQFFPPYDISMDMEDYKKAAVDAYRKHLDSYFDEIRDSLKRHGFTRYKQRDHALINRLVIWNSLECKYIWEAISSIPEFENVDVNDQRQRKSTEGKIIKSFREFESLNLPIRPYGNKRKNKASKNTSK